MNTRMIEWLNVVWANEPKNYTGAASTDLYASLATYERILIAIQTGAWAGGTAAVTLKQATAPAGTSAKALNFAQYWTKTSATDVATKVTAVSNTFNLDTANELYLIEVVASDLDVANAFNSVAVDIASPGGNNDLYGVLYIMDSARYPQAILPSAEV